MPGDAAALTAARGADRAARRSRMRRIRTAFSGTVAGLLGLAPHVLHHAGPIAGGATFAGVGGSLLFGALGLLAAIPFLVRVRRRSGGWRRPLAMLALFAAVFSVSTFALGPALAGDDDARPSGPSAQPAPDHAHDRHR